MFLAQAGVRGHRGSVEHVVDCGGERSETKTYEASQLSRRPTPTKARFTLRDVEPGAYERAGGEESRRVCGVQTSRTGHVTSGPQTGLSLVCVSCLLYLVFILVSRFHSMHSSWIDTIFLTAEKRPFQASSTPVPRLKNRCNISSRRVTCV